MVGKHHPARANANSARAASDITHQHGGGRTGDTRHVVVLGQPVALEPQPFDMLGGTQRNGERVGHRTAFTDGDQIKHRQGDIFECFHGNIFMLGWAMAIS